MDPTLSMRNARVRRILLCAAVLCSCLPGLSLAQSEGTWRVFLNGNDVRALAARGEDVWSATTGGVLRFNQAGESEQWNREVGGLLSDSVSAAGIDADGNMWFGTYRAGISVFNPESGTWRAFNSLLEAIPGDRIRRVRFSGPAEAETLRVAAEAGYSIFTFDDARQVWNYRGGCQQGVDICDLPSYDVFDLLQSGDSLWLATAAGPAVQFPPRPPAPGGWRTHAGGLGGAAITLLARADGRLYGAGPGGVWAWREGTWERANTGAGAPPDSFAVNDMIADGGTLWISGRGAVYRHNAEGWNQVGSNAAWDPPGHPESRVAVTALTRTASGRLFAGASDPLEVADGIWEFAGGQWVQHRLRGPSLNAHYRSLLFDADGALWTAAAEQGFSPVVSRFLDGSWRLFYGGGSGRLGSWTRNIAEAGGKLWLAHCCCERNVPNCRMEQVNRGDLSFLPFDIANAQDVTTDEQGNLWVATLGGGTTVPPNGIYRVDLQADSILHVTHAEYPELRSDAVSAIRVAAGTVWIGYQNEGLSRWEPATNYWKHYDETDTVNPIIGNDIQTIAVGPDGRVWIGTTAGLSIFRSGTMTSIAADGRLPAASVVSILPTTDGGAWVGTRGGGLTHMTRRSTGGFTYQTYGLPYLPSPTVEAMTFDPDGTTIWLGTDRGLVRFVPPGGPLVTDAADTGAYPNPFRPGCGDGLKLVGFGGPVSGVVTDMAGHVVARFPSNGQDRQEPTRSVWDGRHEGRNVAPGLYLVRVHSATGIRSIGVAVLDGTCGH